MKVYLVSVFHLRKETWAIEDETFVLPDLGRIVINSHGDLIVYPTRDVIGPPLRAYAGGLWHSLRRQGTELEAQAS